MDLLNVLTTTANGNSELNVVARQPVNVNGVRVTYYPRLTKGNTHFSPALLRGLNKQLSSFEIVHIHGWWNLVSVLSLCLASWKRKKIVLSPRGSLSLYSIKNTLRKLVIKICNRWVFQNLYFHVTTHKEKNEIVEIIGSKNKHRVFVIPNIIISKEVDIVPPPTQQNESISFLFIGRIDPVKNLEQVIEALSGLNKPFTLKIVGGSRSVQYQAQLMELATRFKIGDRIEWLGETFDQEVKNRLMSQADFLLLLSHTENFGNAVVEALQHNLPVIVSKNVGAAEIVNEENLGWICSGTTKDILNTIENAIADREKIMYIKANAALVFKNKYNPNRITEMYLEMYRNIGTKADR